MALLSLPLPFLILSASYGATVALTKHGRRDPGSMARACFGGESEFFKIWVGARLFPKNNVGAQG